MRMSSRTRLGLLALVVHRVAASPLIGTYWTAYGAADLGPNAVDYVSINQAQYFAAGLAANGTLTGLDGPTIASFVQYAQAEDVAVGLTIGGWDDSANFSPVVADAGLNTTFLSQIGQAVQQYKFTGIQIDWEYPGQQGAPANAVSPYDVPNFILFLQQLRAAQPALQLSVAGYNKGFASTSNYADIAAPLDYLVIMAYDMDQDLNVTAPTAPLNLCNGQADDGSIASAISLYKSSQFPASKLVLGIPTYGHAFTVSSPVVTQDGSVLYQPSAAQQEVQFSDLIHWNILESDGLTPGSNGSWTRVFDACSQTPVLYDDTQSMVISYDDPQSVRAKAVLAAQQGLMGVYFYAASGDYNGLLAKAAAAGFASQATKMVAGLIGGIVGGIVLVVLIFIAARWQLARRRKQLDEKEPSVWHSPELASSDSSTKESANKSDMVVLEDYYSRSLDSQTATTKAEPNVSSRRYLPSNLPEGVRRARS